MGMLKRQHEDIFNIIRGIKAIIQQGNMERDAADIASQINTLAGKLRIHLISEDEFMYPFLLNSENSELKNIAREFIDEMGNISNEFMEYKNRYNTKSKILNDKSKFLVETESIFKALENRIEKENKFLYPLIKS